ncbi:MAG: DNA primase [Methylotetracoccus sp.]
MAGRFTQQFLDELLARIDIVDLIDTRVPLKRSGGSNYVACCPFHDERTPSFSVSRPKQFYHCFGCGVSGDAISFLMQYERLAFPEAVTRLAEQLGMPLPASSDAQSDAREASLSQRLFDLQARVAAFYARQLKTHPSAAVAVEYLKRRGVSGETARRFQIGYAPPGWNNLPSEFPAEDLDRLGLLVTKGSSRYDRFRSRIMFPIRDRRGRVIGFGGRVLDDATPKYLNSPETVLFKKGSEVYGLHEALAASRSVDRFVVVEGYLDVIALSQHGLAGTVATLGTATTPEQVSLLFRYAREIVFCFDGDAAGRKAASKAMRAVLPALSEGQTIRFLSLPEGEDPDSLIRREGRERFAERLGAAELLSDYFFSDLAFDLNLDTIEGRTGLIARARPLLQMLKPGAFRQLMADRLAALARPPRFVRREPTGRPARETAGRSAVNIPAGRRMLALLVQNPQLAIGIEPGVRERFRKGREESSLFLRLLDLIERRPATTTDALLAAAQGTEDAQVVSDLASLELLVPADGVDREFADVLRHALARVDEQRLEVLIGRARDGELDGDEREELRALIGGTEGVSTRH